MLFGRHIALRPVVPQDFEGLITDLFAQRGVMAGLQRPWLEATPDSVRTLLQEFPVQATAIHKATGAAVGWVGAHRMDLRNGAAYVTGAVHPRCTGMWRPEIFQVFIEALIDDYDLLSVYLEIPSFVEIKQTSLERMGAEHLGTFVEHFRYASTWADVAVYRIRRRVVDMP